MPHSIFVLVDENLRGELLRRLARQMQAHPGLDLQVMQVGDAGAPSLGSSDEALLTWCVETHFCLVSNDRRTIPPLIRDRSVRGLDSPPIFLLRPHADFRAVVETIILIAEASDPSDWPQGVTWIPL